MRALIYLLLCISLSTPSFSFNANGPFNIQSLDVERGEANGAFLHIKSSLPSNAQSEDVAEYSPLKKTQNAAKNNENKESCYEKNQSCIKLYCMLLCTGIIIVNCYLFALPAMLSK